MISENKDKVPENIASDLQKEIDTLKTLLSNKESEATEINEAIEKVNVALQTFGQNLPQQENKPPDPQNDDDKSDEDDTVDGEYKEV